MLALNAPKFALSSGCWSPYIRPWTDQVLCARWVPLAQMLCEANSFQAARRIATNPNTRRAKSNAPLEGSWARRSCDSLWSSVCGRSNVAPCSMIRCQWRCMHLLTNKCVIACGSGHRRSRRCAPQASLPSHDAATDLPFTDFFRCARLCQGKSRIRQCARLDRWQWLMQWELAGSSGILTEVRSRLEAQEPPKAISFDHFFFASPTILSRICSPFAAHPRPHHSHPAHPGVALGSTAVPANERPPPHKSDTETCLHLQVTHPQRR